MPKSPGIWSPLTISAGSIDKILPLKGKSSGPGTSAASFFITRGIRNPGILPERPFERAMKGNFAGHDSVNYLY